MHKRHRDRYINIGINKQKDSHKHTPIDRDTQEIKKDSQLDTQADTKRYTETQVYRQTIADANLHKLHSR